MANPYQISGTKSPKTNIQGVLTLSVQSNLQISPLQNWPNFNNLGSNLPQDHCNLPSIVDSCENSIIFL